MGTKADYLRTNHLRFSTRLFSGEFRTYELDFHERLTCPHAGSLKEPIKNSIFGYGIPKTAITQNHYYDQLSNT